MTCTLLAVVVTAHLLGLLTAFHSCASQAGRRTEKAWVVLLLCIPYLAVPLYWLLGRSLRRSFHRSWQKDRNTLPELHEEVAKRLAPHRSDGRLGQPTMERMSCLPQTAGNRFTVLVNGENTFRALYQAMDGAEEVILTQFYLIRDDRAGEAYRHKLLSAARRGVRVYLYFDPIESGLTAEQLDELREAGIKIGQHAPVTKKRNLLRLNNRNHRKITVIDGRRAFFGGLNVGDEYMDRVPELAPWRDTHFELRGSWRAVRANTRTWRASPSWSLSPRPAREYGSPPRFSLPMRVG